MKVIILCGGKGTRLREETEYKPKPMVSIGGRPILWHIMKIYAHHGITDFILALGYKGDVIRDYFLNYDYYSNDFTIRLGEKRQIIVHDNHIEKGWNVTLVETGEDNMTGSRIKQCEKYIDENTFMVTYGDGLGNINLNRLLDFHRSHGKIGTLTGINPASRWGELKVVNDQIVQFMEKPQNHKNKSDINGGFMVFNKKLFDYLQPSPDCIFEKKPLSTLAETGELMLYHHDGFWSAMDTYRDYLYLNNFLKSGDMNPPWMRFDE